jgi:hypothetical protein
MNGFNNLPNKTDQNTYIFYANTSGSISGSFQAWNVPEYAAFLHFTVIGGGAGGGSGYFNGGALVTAFGGGGGAAAGIVAVSIPAILLPKTLYLQVGYGGKGGAGQTATATGNNGESGSLSYVCLYPEINAGSVLIQSSNVAPGGGLGGTITGGAGAATGTAITLADTTNLKWLGIVGNTVAQTAGTAGQQSNTAATSITYAGLLTGGAGGGGIRNTTLAGNGGNITFTSIGAAYAISAYNIAGGSNSSTNGLAGGDGNVGLFQWKPFLLTGGAGGGGAGNLGRGGNGGKGAYGCGGGGGGAGTATSSGKGGDGGDGLIIITVS